MAVSPINTFSGSIYSSLEKTCYPLMWLVEKIQHVANIILDAVLPRNPVTKKREFHFIPLWFKKWWERVTSEIYYDRVCPKWRISEDRALCERVDRIGKRLTANFQEEDWEFEFRVKEAGNELNAACLPRGKIFITTKLIEKLDSTPITDADCKNLDLDQKIASVLAHEIIHARARHSANRMQFLAIVALIVYLAGYFFGLISAIENLPVESILKVSFGHGFLAASVLSTVFWRVWDFFQPIDLLACKYNRTQEVEADVYGMHLLQETGFRPEGLICVLRIFMELMPRANNFIARFLEFYDYHPPSEERVEICRKELMRLQQ